MLPKRLSGNGNLSYTPTGALSSQVTFWMPSTTRDNDGNLTPPTQIATVWASITMTYTPTDSPKQQQVVGETRYKIVIRYMPGLSTKMYVTTATGRKMTLTAIVDPDDRQVELHVFAMGNS